MALLNRIKSVIKSLEPTKKEYTKYYELSTWGEYKKNLDSYIIEVRKENPKFKTVTEEELKEKRNSVFKFKKINPPVHLQSEPKNKHDKFAVKVLIDGIHIGYIDGFHSEEVTNLLKKEIIEVVLIYKSGAYKKYDHDLNEVITSKYDNQPTVRIKYLDF